jgi:hypothetical protein
MSGRKNLGISRVALVEFMSITWMARRLIELENHSSRFEIVFDQVMKKFWLMEPTN